MSIESTFRGRAKEVRAYLKSLQDIEARIQIGQRGFFRAAKTVTASRAAAYIMIYNCIEHAFRECVSATRRDMSQNVQDFSTLKSFWRKDMLSHSFGKKLGTGCNYGEFLGELADFFPGTVAWTAEAEAAIPFNGNIDQQRLHRFRRDIEGGAWKAPKGTLGGNDLTTIRDRRNELAHGEESFDNVGSGCTTADLIEVLDRIRIFMISFIKYMERYRSGQLYKT